jgi:hypothetical protein
LKGYLSEGGMLRVFNQTFRTLLHTRLALGLQAYLRDEHFSGDIIVIEARETDEKFFGTNPIAFWKRADSVRHGFESVRRTLLDHAEVLAPVLERYGLELRGEAPPAPEEKAGADSEPGADRDQEAGATGPSDPRPKRRSPPLRAVVRR